MIDVISYLDSLNLTQYFEMNNRFEETFGIQHFIVLSLESTTHAGIFSIL